MTNLKKINVNGYKCGIGQNSIRNLNLVKLKASGNDKIKNVSFMTNLKILEATNCGIGQKGIKNLNLLKAANNGKIIDVSFMTNLQKLDISDDCGVDQKGIKGLNLVEFYVSYNHKIFDVSFMKNLQILYADSTKICQKKY